MKFSRTGIIGGTGLYYPEKFNGIEVIETKKVSTPFGDPSAPLVLARHKKSGREIVFLPRHGLKHEFLPSEINFRANIWALKSLGVCEIISISATGSLVKEIAPGDLALPNQYFDWTRGKRVGTFFGQGMVAHVSSATPVCQALSKLIVDSAKKADVLVHADVTYACVEGPRLGTRAESFFLKGNGCHLVGMTNVPEVFLALEAQLSYCTLAIATDYDCWLDDPSQHVTVDQVIARYGKTLSKVLQVLDCYFGQSELSHDELLKRPARNSLVHSVLSPEESLDSRNREILQFLKL